MVDLVEGLAAAMDGMAGHLMPSLDFWYSTTFWVYVFWGLW